MANFKKLLSAPAATGGGLNVEDVFSTYLYDGNSGNQTITNGIDLSTEGGMVWIKDRTGTSYHALFDTERGANVRLIPNQTNAEYDLSDLSVNGLTAFNTDGFDLGSWTITNDAADDHVSWTFRKAPKFFDVVTYTGDGTSGRQIAHNLGTTVGFIVVKQTDASTSWLCYHKDANATAPEDYFLGLNATYGAIYQPNAFGAAPTDTHFTVGTSGSTNTSGGSYVAYLFAHNNGDGDFGPTGDQDIIKCGSYTGNASTDGPEIDLGWEPQWVLVKAASDTGGWGLLDNMRGFGVEANEFLYANTSDPENSASNIFKITPTGFKLVSSGSGYNSPSGTNYIYMAIRRGPMAIPESGSDVFAIDTKGTLGAPAYNSGFPVDMLLVRNNKNTTFYTQAWDRLRSTFSNTTSTAAEEAFSTSYLDYFDSNDGFDVAGGPDTNDIAWMWRRAPSFFDVVAYKGNGSTPRDINHNLGVVPEMAWIKKRDGTDDWIVTFLDRPNYSLRLNSSNAEVLDNGGAFLATYSNETTFNVRNSTVNESAYNYIAYLFASLDGVSKVGSYTGTGSQQVIDCGFTSGARFILTKRTDNLSNWIVCDTERGIVSGNDPFLALDATSAEGSQDIFDPNSVGFEVTSNSNANTSGASYIFYAIA